MLTHDLHVINAFVDFQAAKAFHDLLLLNPLKLLCYAGVGFLIARFDRHLLL
jgi:hypothetical protein